MKFPQASPFLRAALRSVLGAALAAAGLASSGCFNMQSLAEASMRSRESDKLEEVDLGMYRVTLPKLPGEAGAGVVRFHVFGKVARRHVHEVRETVEADGAEIRFHVLTSIRAFQPAEFVDPKLNDVRKEIVRVINGSFKEPLVKEIGFYRFAFSRG
jgi:hypothetical protein